MARRRELHPDPDRDSDLVPASGAGGVELLSEVADPAAPSAGASRGQHLAPLVVALIMILGLGLVLLVAGPVLPEPEPEPGGVASLAFRFGDPFALDWVELPQVAGGAVARERPQPMIDRDGHCLGFTRSDWPADERHPSVAHCLDRGQADRFAGADAVGVHRIAAGLETWYFLFFAGPVAELEIAVDPGAGGDAIDGPPPIHQGDTIAAILVPTAATEVTVGWRRADGGRFRAVIS